MMTGRYPPRACWGGRCGAGPGAAVGAGLPKDELTIAAVLKAAGYRTFMTGKWHMGYYDAAPWQHGFSDYFGIPFTNNECRSNLLGLGSETGCRGGPKGGPKDTCGPCPVFDWRNGSASPASKSQGNALGIIEQGAVDFLNIDARYANATASFIAEQASAKTPWFVYFCSHHIHWPQFASDVKNGSTPRGPVGDGLATFDATVGEVMAAVMAAGALSSTLVVLTGDNGGYILTPDWLAGGTPTQGGVNGVLRCGKGTSYEGGMRLPGIAYWPGRIKAATVTSEITSHIDLLPTFCALAKGCVLPKVPLDGFNLSPLLFSKNEEAKSPRQSFFYYSDGPVANPPQIANVNGIYDDTNMTEQDASARAVLMASRVGEYKAHFYTQGWSCYGKFTTDAQEMVAGISDPACGAQHKLTKHEPPLLNHLGRDVGEYVPVNASSNEYAKAMEAILAAVAAQAKVMTYRGAAPPSVTRNDTAACYLSPATDAGWNRTLCFPCASIDCDPKPSCCATPKRKS